MAAGVSSRARKSALTEIAVLPDPADRRILALLTGAREETHYGYSPYYYDSVQSTFSLVATVVGSGLAGDVRHRALCPQCLKGHRSASAGMGRGRSLGVCRWK